VARVDPWSPLSSLGPVSAAAVDRALSSGTVDEVVALLTPLAPSPGLAVAKFLLLQRRGDDPVGADAAARAAIDALSGRDALLVTVEHASVLAASKARLGDARAIARSLPTPADDPALSAAVLRVRGAIARADGDLGASLLALESARTLARDAADVREIIRAENTLGASYAALGVAALARDALESALELAEITGQKQSAAIARGQLAVLSLDADDARLAARNLEAQRAIATRLGDVHGLARSLSLLVEAYAACHEPGLARDAAEQSRALYGRAPTAWTRLSAVLATIYQAEAALAAGDAPSADELLATTTAERASDDPALRVAHARDAFVRLLSAPPTIADPDAFLTSSLAPLRRSPRPTWVLRALLLALRLASSRGWNVTPLALRAAAVLEARGAASSRALLTLRAEAPDAAVRRAMALGRDLVFEARLALGPLSPFEAHVLQIDGHDIDAVLSALGDPPDDLLVSFAGSRVTRLVSADAARLAAVAGGRAVSPCVAEITHVASAGLDLDVRPR
jgi:tetratricopeptide (TPR) repeat protein